MRNRNYSSEGFIIGKRKFGEADRIITLFTKDFGKLTFIAKGVRKTTSRKRGSLEVFNKIKFSATKTNGMDILTEVQVLETPDIKNDLKKMTVAYFFCEVINKVTRDEERHAEVYKILEKYFKDIESTKLLKSFRKKFVADVLISLGFWPDDKEMTNPDAFLESIIERKLSSSRVGKKMLQQE